MQRFDDYDPFAWVYAHYWGGDFHDRIMPALESAGLHDLPKGAAVLDLCCGDGRLTERLLRLGFRVTGVDASSEMLTYARKRCPQAEFHREDARDFNLPVQFDAVVSTFDSLNHVTRTRDLCRVFCNVSRCLKPQGLFLFDLNGVRVYRDVWSTPASIVNEEVVSIARGEYDSHTRTALCNVTLMRLMNGDWKRSDFRLVQKCHSTQTVLSALETAGFTVTVHEAAALGMEGHYSYGREVYVARKVAPRPASIES